MPSDPSILIYGRDEFLLQTRSWVLEKAGFHVRTTMKLADAAHELNLAQIRILILCHTLNTDECSQVLESAHSLRPDLRVLVLAPQGDPCTADERDVVLTHVTGTRYLLAAVQKIAELTAAPSQTLS